MQLAMGVVTTMAAMVDMLAHTANMENMVVSTD